MTDFGTYCLLQEAQEKKETETNSTETGSGDGEEQKDDAWAKLGDTISSFFGGQSSMSL